MTKKEKPKSSKVAIVLLTVGITMVALFILPILFLIFIGILIGTADIDTPEPTGRPNVAHLTVSGTILTETAESYFTGSSDTSSKNFVKTIDKIKQDDSIKAILIEINSPGGSGVASDEIAQALQSLDIPTVSYIREVGASGSYWVASSTDYIFANRFSTIGSIGVIASYLDFSEFLTEYNVSYQRFVAGENKDFGSPFREVTPTQEARFQAILDELHAIFISEVANGRDADIEDITKLADGSIFTASEAVKNGLIDEIGTEKNAIAYLEEILGEEIVLTRYQKDPSFFDLLAGYTANNFYAMGLGIGEKMTMKTAIGSDNPLFETQLGGSQ